MGRGRAKAKQTKVARELKYFSPDTDLNALERELSSGTHKTAEEAEESSRNDDDYGDYADWASHRD